MKAASEVWNSYRGTVRIKIEGYRIEKLLSRAAASGVKIRDARVISEFEVRCSISAADLKKIRKLAGPLYTITVTGERGPEKLVKNIVKKPAAAAGVFLAASIVIIQSMFVSTVHINGYRAIPEDELRRCLADSGVEEGAFRPDIDWEQARDDLADTFPQLTWIQLVYEGRTVWLNVAESSSKILSSREEEETDIFVPSAKKDAAYSSIVAAESGYVSSVNTLWGTALVSEGDYVQKGDVLISGIVPIEPTTYEEDAPKEYYVRAAGQVTGLVPYRLTFNQERYIEGPEADPEMVKNLEEKTEDQVMATLNQQIRLWAKENLPESAEIVNKSLNFSHKKNIIEVGVTLEVRRELGTEKEISVGQ